MAALGRRALLAALRKRGIQLSRVPPTLAQDAGRVTLTMTLEHVIAYHMLQPRPDFFFLQVGAFDGVTSDPLHAAILRYDWAGMLIEPQPVPFAALSATYADRPRLMLRNVAVGASNGTQLLYSVAGGPAWSAQLASFDPEVILRHDSPGADLRSNLVSHEVECLTFESLLSAIDTVDLLQIDTEGYDAALIALFDFRRWRPSIVQFEHKHLTPADHDAAIKRLAQHGFRITVGHYDTLAYNDDRR
jgi:FkbM family methyltransferase